MVKVSVHTRDAPYYQWGHPVARDCVPGNVTIPFVNNIFYASSFQEVRVTRRALDSFQTGRHSPSVYDVYGEQVTDEHFSTVAVTFLWKAQTRR